jgi:hypothetical protein
MMWTSLFKSFKLGEVRNLRFEGSSFTIANKAQFGMPSVPSITAVKTTPAQAAAFGQIAGNVNSPLQFQFGSRFTF